MRKLLADTHRRVLSNSRFKGQRDGSQLPRRETTIATVRSECIGLRAFLHKRRIPGFDNPAEEVGSQDYVGASPLGFRVRLMFAGIKLLITEK